MNIIEAYIKKHNSLIIVISGMPGCNKSSYARIISRHLKLSYIDQSDYDKKDYSNPITIKDIELNNIYTDDAIDWDSFNSKVNELKKDGVIITGVSFPQDLIKFNVDLHIHLFMSMLNCIEKRKQYISKHKDFKRWYLQMKI